MDNAIFKREEAQGLLVVVSNYLLNGYGDLPILERRGLGRLLSEISYSLDNNPPPKDTSTVVSLR